MRSFKSGVAVLGLFGAAASGQTFVTYDIDGVNLTTKQSGRELRARPGDVIRVAVRPVHDGMSFGAGELDVLLAGVMPVEIGLLEEDGDLPPGDPWTVGRTPVIWDGSERPDGVGGDISARPDPGLYGVDTVITDDELRFDRTDWFDFASTPPGLGGLTGGFPVESGDRLFVFDYEYVGGTDIVLIASGGAARLWRSVQDINGVVVPAEFGEGLTVFERCEADLDGDGDADSDDFFVYLDAFANDDLDICDINHSTECDSDDFFAYLDLFAAGC